MHCFTIVCMSDRWKARQLWFLSVLLSPLHLEGPTKQRPWPWLSALRGSPCAGTMSACRSSVRQLCSACWSLKVGHHRPSSPVQQLLVSAQGRLEGTTSHRDRKKVKITPLQEATSSVQPGL